MDYLRPWNWIMWVSSSARTCRGAERVVITDASKRSSQDRSISGYKKMLKDDPVKAKALADQVIKNTYRTHDTRAERLLCIPWMKRPTSISVK